MSLAQQLWQTHHDLAQACLGHPFVQGIATGSLPRATFAYYVGQDAFFLEAFARAYSICAAKAPTWQDFGIFQTLAGGVLEELRLHQGYASQWGVDLQAVQPGATTQRYADFLLAIAWSQPVGMTTVAMAPCMRLYAYLGQEVARREQPSPEQHPYMNWIQTYSQPFFADLAEQLETLLDRYNTAQPDRDQVGLGATEASVVQVYRYAMQCEFDFFQAAWEAVG